MDDAENYLAAIAFATNAVNGHATAITEGREPDPTGDRITQWTNHYAHAVGVDPADIHAARTAPGEAP